MIILIVDAREIVRSGLKKALASNHIFHEAAQFTGIKSILQTVPIDLVIINQSLITDICQLPSGRFLIIASEINLQILRDAYLHGALGYLLESCPEELLRVVTSLSTGQFLLDPTLTPESLGAYLRGEISIPNIETLTLREQEIFSLLHIGMSNKDMANQLQISETTIKTHIAHIYKKIGINGRSIKLLIK